MNITRDEIRVMIYYDYKKSLSQQECLESLQKTFGDSSASRATVYNWYAEFNRGRDHFEDELRAGRPRSAVILENIEAVRQLTTVDPIHTNRYKTTYRLDRQQLDLFYMII